MSGLNCEFPAAVPVSYVMPIIQHGLDAQGQPRWVRERFEPGFYTVPPDWIAKLRSDGRQPSVYELLDNDRGGPLDGMLVVREVVREGRRFVVLSNNASVQFAVEIERDAKCIADAEIRALSPEEAWAIAREYDARSSPPTELMPEPVRILYDADREKRAVIFRRDKDGSFGYEEQRFSVQPWERDEMRRTPDWAQRYPKRWERAWKLLGGDLLTRCETAEQALAEARADIPWLADRLKNDGLKLVDMTRPGGGGGPDKTAAGAERRPEGGTSRAKRLEVKTRGLQFVSLILLGLFMVPLGSALVIGELAKGVRLSPAPLLIGIAPLVIYGAVVWLFRRAYVKSVKFFSDDGLVRNDGRGFAWSGLSRVVYRVRLNRTTGVKFIWRTEIQFQDGESAWLLPTKIGNFAEVYELVRRLPCEHTEVRA